MPFTKFFTSSAKPRDEETDIHSNSSTPPGAATPHPDPADKRFPGILSSYFGQVRTPSEPNTPWTRVSPSEEGYIQVMTHGVEDLDDVLPHGESVEKQRQEETVEKHTQEETVKLQENTNTSQKNSAQKDSSKIEASRDTPRVHQYGFEPLPYRTRKNSSSPWVNMSTEPTVSSSNISSSGHIVSPTDASTPVVDSLSALRSIVASPTPNDQQKLTTNVSSSKQNTPPRTPRSSSHASRASRAASPSQQQQQQQQQAVPRTNESKNNAVLREQRGKIYITISEGRGLRPSVNPYVVCQFQCNEYISRGPRQNESAIKEDGSEDGQGGVPIQRTASDTGRPRAIPMKSRQSSHTSVASRESANKTKEVTDPLWNHEAVL